MIKIPTKCGKRDSKGSYCQFGSKGAKYYYDPNDSASKERARNKANKQGQAIQVNKNDEKKVEIVPKTAEKEEKCTDCEPKLEEIGEKTTENELKSAENLQEMIQNDLKIEGIVPEIPKYEPPEDKNSLNEGHFVRFKDKIGKIVKVIS